MVTVDLWFSEAQSCGSKLSIKINAQCIYSESDEQEIAIYDTPDFGRILVLDGRLMLTEKDEYIYHEMIVHPAMAVHPAVENVLIIGGGDGGALRELCRYDSIKSIEVAEIDEEVIKACQEWFPDIACSFDDPRVKVSIGDGLKYVRQKEDEYDLIIVDSTDPFGPGESLFTKEFYGNCYKALKADGILINQHESPFFVNDAAEVSMTHRKLKAVFPIALLYQAHIPTYPSGHWLFGFSSKTLHPLDDHKPEAWAQNNITCRYYNNKLHRGSFALPNYVLDLLSSDYEI